MHAQNLAGRGDLEALLRAAMGLELHLGFVEFAGIALNPLRALLRAEIESAPFLNFAR